MPRTWYNHVTVHARDMRESQQFYEDILGAEPAPMPNMGAPILWLKLGDLQLHIGDLQRHIHGELKSGEEQSDPVPIAAQHFAVTVEDFEELYRLVQERGVPEDDVIWGHPLNVLPSGQVQYYIRDPAGNLVEIDFPDASSLPADIKERANFQVERFAQTEDQLKAGLVLDRRGSDPTTATK